MRPRGNIFCLLMVGIVMVGGTIAFPAFGADPEAAVTPSPKTVYENLELFIRVMELVNDKYVEETDRQELIHGALQGMLGSLDSYSQFMEPEIYQEMQVETKGQFGGVGIEITLRDGVLTVISPIEDTPASRAGLLPGDKIVKIEDETTKDITLMEAVKKLRGEPGDPVNITVLRAGEQELLDFTIVRAIIKIESVKDVKMLDEKIGYIRIAQFTENTLAAFDEAIEELDDQDVKGLVLDLRYNPGGLLTTAIGVADRFLKKGQLIVETRGRDKQVEMEARATGRDLLSGVPIVILVNEGSASGSEIVAGALRDNYRAVLVGKTTFGKGSVQSVLPLPDESGLRLTTGRYYTSAHRSIEEDGVEPDVEITMTDEEKKDFYLKKYRALEELEKQAEEEEAEEEEEETAEEREEDDFRLDDEEEEEELLDPQLQAAVNILRGILIQQEFNREADLDS